jgi:chromosome partitioning protein
VRAKILAVANCKGGTGKSTVAVNLAAELGSRGYRVLVGDLDPQGHAGLGLGVVAAEASRTIHVAFRAPRIDLARAIVTNVEPGVDLIPADRNFDGRIPVGDPRCLAHALEPIRSAYHVILLDTPPSAANVIVSALLASDGALVPTCLDYLSLDGVRQFARSYHHVMLKMQATLLGLAIAPMQVDLRKNMQKLVLARLLNSFGRSQVISGIRIDVSVAEAFGCDKPVRRYRPDTRAVGDFRVMADDVKQRFNLGRLSLPDGARSTAIHDVPVAPKAMLLS